MAAVSVASDPGQAAGQEERVRAELTAGPKLQSGETLRRLRDDLAHQTLLERALRQRLGEAHPETRAQERMAVEASHRLDAEVERLAGPAGAASPRLEAGTASNASPWRQRPLATTIGAIAIALALALLAVLGLLARRHVRTANPRLQSEAAPVEEVSVSLAMSTDERGLLQAARSGLCEPAGAVAASMQLLLGRMDAHTPSRAERIIVLIALMAETEQALLASNLAHELVYKGERTLLVDADVGAAMLTRILLGGYPAPNGGTRSNDAILLDQVSGLWFLPARADGGAIAVADIERLRLVFDTILIAAPPLAARHDAAVVSGLARLADQILLVRPDGRTPVEITRLAQRKLDVDPGKILHVRLRIDPAHPLDHPLTAPVAPPVQRRPEAA